MPALQGLGYSFAFRHQAQGAGPDDTAAENAGVFGLMKSFDIAKDRALQAIVETAYLSHAGGGPDDLAYLTTGAKLTDGPWNTSASWTMRKTLVADGANYSDDLYQISAGYLFEDGTSLDGGYKYVHQSSGDVQAVRLQVKHEFSF